MSLIEEIKAELKLRIEVAEANRKLYVSQCEYLQAAKCHQREKDFQELLNFIVSEERQEKWRNRTS